MAPGRDRVRAVFRLRAPLTVVLLLATCACTTSYRWKPGRLGPPGTKAASMATSEQSRWAHLFLFGLIGASSVDLRDVCPGPVAAGLRTGTTVETTLVSLITLGVYTPLEHRFTCVIPPPGPLTIPKVVLEETAPLQPELEGWPQDIWEEKAADGADTHRTEGPAGAEGSDVDADGADPVRSGDDETPGGSDAAANDVPDDQSPTNDETAETPGASDAAAPAPGEDGDPEGAPDRGDDAPRRGMEGT